MSVLRSNVPRKILVLRFSSLGDIVMTTAMVRCLRQSFPDARIDMVVREDFLDLIRHNPHLDRKIGLARRSGRRGLLQLARDLKREHYDLVYDAHRSLRTRFLMPYLRADARAYFDKQYLKRDLALTFKLPWLEGMPRFLERFVSPLEPYGVHYDEAGPEVFIDEPTRKRCREKFPLPQLAPHAARIALIPSAQWPGKRWPLDRFRSLIEDLARDTPHQLVVLGGPGDDFCRELCRDLPANRVINTQGKLSILESAAMLEQCHLTIANDTGMMHVADGLGIPSVLILGPTSGGLGCLPFHPRTRVLEHELWCRPCSKNGQAPCVRGTRYCLTRTSVSQVLHEARELAQLQLSGGGRA